MDIFEKRCQWLRNDKKRPCNYSLKDDKEQNSLCDLQWMFRCTEWLRRHEPVLSYSSVRNYVLCRRKYWYSQICGIQLIKTPVKMMLGRIASDILGGLHAVEIKDKGFDYRKIIKKYTQQFIEDYGDGKPPTALIAMEALFDAYTYLDYHALKGKTEFKFEINEPDYPHITGYIDKLIYESRIGYEYKYTGSPDWYDLFTIKEQLGIYFLGVPDLKRITLRLILRPQLKMGKGEGEQSYRERVYEDVKSRPTYYFRDKNFWKNEFDSDDLLDQLKVISNEIIRYAGTGIEAFYPSIPPVCYQTDERQCEYIDICRTGKISEGLYKKRESKDKEKEI